MDGLDIQDSVGWCMAHILEKEGLSRSQEDRLINRYHCGGRRKKSIIDRLNSTCIVHSETYRDGIVRESGDNRREDRSRHSGEGLQEENCKVRNYYQHRLCIDRKKSQCRMHRQNDRVSRLEVMGSN